ncbi:MAG: hypothetical protein COB50_04360 [Thiotrichales bacterium]|nr:MAG: hypothetical protein COB50_04360 [Thiotrichales bacterium]
MQMLQRNCKKLSRSNSKLTTISALINLKFSAGGNIMGPIIIAKAINTTIQGARLLYAICDAVKSNPARCKSIASRVKGIENSLSGLKSKAPSTEVFLRALHNLQGCLQDCSNFVKTAGNRGEFSRLLEARNDAKLFASWNDRLQSAIGELQLGVNIQQLFDREQDKKDLQEDLADLSENLEKIIMSAHNKLDWLADIKEYQKHSKNFHKQYIASIKLQFKELNAEKPTKSLIAQHLLTDFASIKLLKPLQQDNYDSMHQGVWNRMPVAIKWIHKQLDKNAQQEFIREIAIMRKLRSPFITQLYAVCMEQERHCLIMEYCARGSLRAVLDANDVKLTIEQQQTIALSLAQGLYYMHARGVYHRNLTSSHVLVADNGSIKLTDFGLAKTSDKDIATVFEQDQHDLTAWMAPEILQPYGVYHRESDIYSYGMVLWELFTTKKPFANFKGSKGTLGIKIAKGLRENIPSTVPKFYAVLIKECWGACHNRPSLEEIIRRITQHATPKIQSKKAEVINLFVHQQQQPKQDVKLTLQSSNPPARNKVVRTIEKLLNHAYPIVDADADDLQYRKKVLTKIKPYRMQKNITDPQILAMLERRLQELRQCFSEIELAKMKVM